MTAVLATFSDFKIVKGRKQAQFIFEVPLEGAQSALEALGGVPQPDSAQWVGIAPVDADKAQKPAEKPKGGKLAQRAGILCGEASFWMFLDREHSYPATNSAAAASFIRDRCNVKSRADLDHSDDAARAFAEINSNYRHWMRS